MVYAALPDRRIPYDVDGTVVGYGSTVSGISLFPNATQKGVINGFSYGAVGDGGNSGNVGVTYAVWMFFPEQRNIAAYYAWFTNVNGPNHTSSVSAIKGSNDSGNGVDGTWETASLGGTSTRNTDLDWRTGIKSVTFTGPKASLRLEVPTNDQGLCPHLIHLYGKKASGQTPDDLIFIDHDTTPGVEYVTPEDFGDRPLGTTVVRQFRLKNVSPTKVANAVVLTCSDADFTISSDGTTYGTTVNITSIAAGAESATLYVKNTTPAPGAALGPRVARITAAVGSWT